MVEGRSRMASSMMENNSSTSLALSDGESDCQPLERHACDVVMY